MAAFKERTAEPKARIKRIYSPPLLIVTSSEFIFNNIYKYFRFAIIFVHWGSCRHSTEPAGATVELIRWILGLQDVAGQFIRSPISCL